MFARRASEGQATCASGGEVYTRRTFRPSASAAGPSLARRANRLWRTPMSITPRPLPVVLLLLAGCQPAPPRPPDPRDENSHQICRLEWYRAAFDAYASGDRSEAVTNELDAAGCGRPDIAENGRLQFDWPSDSFMSALNDFNPILLYCRHGPADLPDDFWTNGNKYRHPYQIDDHWFAARRSWQTDPPPPRP